MYAWRDSGIINKKQFFQSDSSKRVIGYLGIIFLCASAENWVTGAEGGAGAALDAGLAV